MKIFPSQTIAQFLGRINQNQFKFNNIINQKLKLINKIIISQTINNKINIRMYKLTLLWQNN